MSALPPKADIVQHDRDVRFMPKRDSRSATSSSLFDHLIGAYYSRINTGTTPIGVALPRHAVPPLNSPKPGVFVFRRPSRHEPDPASAGKARPSTAPHPSSGM